MSWNGKPGVLTTTPMNDSRSVRLGYRGTALLNEGEEGYLEFFAGNDEDTKWRLKGYIRYQVNIDTLISSDKPGPAWHLIRIPIKGIAEGQTMDLSLYAENINGEAAVNYWAGFRVVKED